MSKRHIEISEGTASRLIRIGGTLKQGIELASFAPSVDALLKAKDMAEHPSSAAPALVKPAAAPKPTGRPRTRQLSIDEQQAEKTAELLSYGYTQEVAENMNGGNIARCEKEIREGMSPKQIKARADQGLPEWVDDPADDETAP